MLFIGDIVGKAGRRAVETLLPNIAREYQTDAVIANAENAAGGNGITPDIADRFFSLGIDVLTSGNHIWQKREIMEYMRSEPRLLRPLNFSTEAPGAGRCVFTTPRGIRIAVINLLGRVFMNGFSCPFLAIEQEIASLRNERAIILADFHAEATSEKEALGWYVDGKVGAVVGTHTHVQTADERVLPQGTAYITDVGMTGAMDAVLGVKKEQAIQKFLTYMPVRFESSSLNPWLNGVIITFDTHTRLALQIERLQRPVNSNECSKGGMLTVK